MPEELEVRAAPGGGILEMLLGFPLLGSLVDSGSLGGTLEGRLAQSDGLIYRSGRPSAWRRLDDGSDGLRAILAEVRSVLAISPMGNNAAKADHYVQTARTRIELVSAALSSGDSSLDSAGLGHTLRWVGDLFAALDKAAGRRGSSGSGQFFTLDEEPPAEPPPPLPPEAVDDLYGTLHDVPINVSALGVLENDSEYCWAALVSGPAHAAEFALYGDGSFDYTPEYQYVGNDSFVYSANNSAGSDQATVQLCIVNNAPVAVADERFIPHDRPYTEDCPGVMVNDDPVDPDGMAAVLDTGPSQAAAFALQANGSFEYTPNYHFVGQDTFTYHVTDGIADSNTVTVTINVVNHAPNAEDDGAYRLAIVDQDNPPDLIVPSFGMPGILENDTDADWDGLVAIQKSAPSQGTLEYFHEDGSFKYVPNPTAAGIDTFQYVVNDGLVDSNLATVTIDTVNVQIKSIEFTSDHGLLKKTPQADQGWANSADPFSPPEWVKKPERNYPISQTKDTAVTALVTVTVAPANKSFQLIGDDPADYLEFYSTGNVSTGGDQVVTVTACGDLPNYVCTLSPTINWTIAVEGWGPLDAGPSGPHKIYVTYGTPAGSDVTEQRVAKVCEYANGQSTLEGCAYAVLQGMPQRGAAGEDTYGPVPIWRLHLAEYASQCPGLAMFVNAHFQMLGLGAGQIKYCRATPGGTYEALDQIENYPERLVTSPPHPAAHIALSPMERLVLRTAPGASPNAFEATCFFAGWHYVLGYGVYGTPQQVVYAVFPVIEWAYKSSNNPEIWTTCDVDPWVEQPW